MVHHWLPPGLWLPSHSHSTQHFLPGFESYSVFDVDDSIDPYLVVHAFDIVHRNLGERTPKRFDSVHFRRMFRVD